MFHPSTNLRQIIQLAADPNADLRKLGRMIEMEPGLPDRVMRYVNGFYSRAGGRVANAARALAVVGPRVVVEVASQHALISALSHAGMPPKLAAVFWSNSIQRAMCARMLADACRAEVNEDLAFTIGLALDFGTGILLCRESHLQLAWVKNVRRLSGEQRLDAEAELFGMDRTEAFMSVAEDWGLADETVKVVGQYLEKDRPGLNRSNEMLYEIAVWSNALGEAALSPASSKDLRYWATNVSKTFSLANSAASDLSAQVLKRTAVAGKMLGLDTGTQAPSKELFNRNGTGAPQSMDKYELLEWSDILEEQNYLLANRVDELQVTLRQKGSRDVVTGLMTVQSMLAQLETEVKTARLRGQSLAIILVDIDGFTELNAHYGYDAGDVVLRKTGETLKKVVRGMELVGRIAADCFALVYAGDERAAKVIGERARAAIQAMQVDLGNQRIRVTATIAGLNLNEIPTTHNAQQFLSATQHLLNTRYDMPKNTTIWKDPDTAIAK